MGVVRFRVVFDKPEKVYYSGELITGKVELVLNSLTNIKEAAFKLKGRAKCEWNESEIDGDDTTIIRRKSTETYLSCEQVLIEERNAKLELPKGEYVYEFAVRIPLKSPPSFIGSYGEISYYGKTIIDTARSIKKKERTKFTVINPLYLKLYPNFRTPCMYEKSKMFCCLWCANGFLTMVVRLPKTIFAVTECIPITLEIDNASNVILYAVHIYLKRKISWKAEGHHKHKKVELQKLRSGGVREGQSHTWNEYFTIPSCLFPNLERCSLIKMSHELHIETELPGLHSNLTMQIPVTISDILLTDDPNDPNVSLHNAMTATSSLTSFSALNSLSSINETSVISVSEEHPQTNDLTGVNPSPKATDQIQLLQSEVLPITLPFQPVTKLTSSQNTFHPVKTSVKIKDNIALLSSDNTVQQVKTSFLDDCNNRDAEK